MVKVKFGTLDLVDGPSAQERFHFTLTGTTLVSNTSLNIITNIVDKNIYFTTG